MKGLGEMVDKVVCAESFAVFTCHHSLWSLHFSAGWNGFKVYGDVFLTHEC